MIGLVETGRHLGEFRYHEEYFDGESHQEVRVKAIREIVVTHQLEWGF